MELISHWDTGDQFDRVFELRNESGEIIQRFEDYPSLNQLRSTERKIGGRINLLNAGLPCANCGKEIVDRFAADPRGNIVCWDCALEGNGETQAGIRVNSDPSNTTVSESHLYEKSLCDYVVNVATGCRHGCKFCYVPTTPGYKNREDILEEEVGVTDIQGEWGSYLLYRDDLPERIGKEIDQVNFDDWTRTERGRGIVMLSSGTDPYQDRRASQITRGVITEFVTRSVPVRVLTRSSIAVQDVDLFKNYADILSIGSSIPSLNSEIVNVLEPGAPPSMTRLQMLDMLRMEGASIYVSMSPTYPTLSEHELFRLLTQFKGINPDVIFHEPINPRGSNFEMIISTLEKEGKSEEADTFRRLQTPETWVRYALCQLSWVQKKAESLDAPPIHSWPDRMLLRATSGELRDQLAGMRQSISPESFNTDSKEEHSSDQAPLFENYDEIEHLVDSTKISF